MSTGFGVPNKYTNAHAYRMDFQEDFNSKPVKAPNFIFHACIFLGSKTTQNTRLKIRRSKTEL